MQIRLHEFLHEVNLLEIIETGGSQDVENRDDVLVMEVTQQLYLAKRSQTEHRVIKGGNTLYRDLPLGGYVYGGAVQGLLTGIYSERVAEHAPDDTVCTLTNNIQDLIVGATGHEACQTLVHVAQTAQVVVVGRSAWWLRLLLSGRVPDYSYNIIFYVVNKYL